MATRPPEEEARVWGCVAQSYATRSITVGRLTSLTPLAFRQVWRRLERRPSEIALWVGQLGLTVGAVTALASLLVGLTSHPVALRSIESLMVLHERGDQGDVGSFVASDAEFEGGWSTLGGPFERVAAYAQFQGDLQSADSSAPFVGCSTAGDLFGVLGVRFLRGRAFSRDDLANQADLAIVSEAFWRTVMGGRPDVLGAVLPTAEGTLKVVGVVADGSVYPPKTDLWVPHKRYLGPGNLFNLTVIGRLKPGWQSQPAALAVNANTPSERGQGRLVLVPLAREVVGDSRMGPIAVVLLLAGTLAALAVSLLHMCLARGVARQPAVFLSFALGATPTAIVWTTLIEHSVLGVLTMAVAPLVSTAIFSWVLPATPVAGLLTTKTLLWQAIKWQPALVALLVPVAVAIETWGTALGHQRIRLSLTSPQRHRWGPPLAFSQALFSTSLLVVTVAILTSGFAVRTTSVGVNERGLSTFSLTIPSKYKTPADRSRLCDSVLEELRRIPTVAAAAIGRTPLLVAAASDNPELAKEIDSPHLRFVTDAYLSTLGVRVLEGRGFEPSDSRAGVAVVNQEYVRRFGRGGAVVGSGITASGRRQVLGVVSDVRDVDIWVRPRPLVYLPFDAVFAKTISVILRAKAKSVVTFGDVRRAVTRTSGELAVHEFETLEAKIRRATAPWNARSSLAGCAGVFTVCLLIAGVHSIIGFLLQEQKRALALRLALGGGFPAVVRALEGSILRPVVLGALMGLALGVGVLTALRSVLSGAGPTIAASVISLLLVLTSACWLVYRAARRTERADAWTLLRAE